ncbi:MAG: hypothetical protein HN742_26880 [Lentisphaerae bacterium]|jgi:hypothetical protein|nr:hypothetical protein [Lentisphaerota bacterium]MBT5606074.1 hypothetical protein [Lentisphaerota bacterium]MBT7057055.1 hypothetical protein [Lentisphaerota bacterium]MBT7845527.1 hypothetical protein [Lentisphaerota bacterium]
MNVRTINKALREGHTLYARGQFRAFRVYGARTRNGQKELDIAFGVIGGKCHHDWVPVRGFGMVVEAKDGSVM